MTVEGSFCRVGKVMPLALKFSLYLKTHELWAISKADFLAEVLGGPPKLCLRLLEYVSTVYAYTVREKRTGVFMVLEMPEKCRKRSFGINQL